jgi:hypothetical protein
MAAARGSRRALWRLSTFIFLSQSSYFALNDKAVIQ